MMKRILSLAFWAFALALLVSCGNARNESAWPPGDTLQLRHATLLHICAQEGMHVVEIDNPWKPGQTLHRYLLVPSSQPLPDDLPEGTVVRTPLRHATVFTSVHSSLLADLGALNQVAGICDFEYILSPSIRHHVESGAARNMGSALNPNVELILSSGSDGLLVSPFENAGYGRLERANIPLIECADYMETSALGRAEWMRFYGLLFGCEARADSLFAAVKSRYDSLKTLAAIAQSRPKLLCDGMNGAAWYVPGGQSTLAKLYADAGADYLFKDYAESGSVRLSMETVIQRAAEADIWLYKYGAAHHLSYAQMQRDCPQYAAFRPFQQRAVYHCNTAIVPFYEEEPFHPDILLADAIRMFHPELLPNHTLRYFTPLP